MSSSDARRTRRASRKAKLTPEASFLLCFLRSRFGYRKFSHEELVSATAELAGVSQEEMALALSGLGEKLVH